jgi:hypothetical protein
LLVEYQSRHASLSHDAIAELLHGVFGDDVESFKRLITNMVDAGSRYRNLEKSIGLGAALVLGTELSETT